MEKQKQKIKKYLDEHGSITSLEAMTKLNIGRLASRMHELKREGYQFTVTTEKSQSGARYARYRKCTD